MQTYPTGYAESHRIAEQIFREILPRHSMAVREEQIALCHEVLDTLYNKEISLCEAGVGTGKTLAYLVGCILWQMHRPERMNKVALVKNEKNWKLSLENLLGMKFDSDKDTDDDGLEYRDYIRMLLMLERSEHKNYRTMGAMEIKMISMGHDDFRMRNYIVSMAGTAVFSVIRRGQPYVQIISCSYI